MHKKLSLLTVIFITLFTLPFAAAGGYAIGYSVGAELHDKGDMGTGLGAIALLFVLLPVAITTCVLSILIITKILKDLYDNGKIKLIIRYLIIGLGLVAGVGLLYPVLNTGMWQY